MGRKVFGQNLTEIGILIALVALVAILAYTMLGKNINSMISKSETEVSNYQPFGVGYDKKDGYPVYKAGELGGSSGTPVISCTGGHCSIDYGDFILNGIPDDFGEIVETSGTSGGTEDLVSILASIGDQITDPDSGDGDSAEDFKLIANLGHFMAAIQEQSEIAAKACASDADPVACFNQKNNDYKANPILPPDNIKGLLTSWPNGFDDLQGILSRCDLGWGANAGLPPSYTNINISMNVMNAYDRVMAADSGDGVTPEMQQIATELIVQLDKLNDNLYRVHENLKGGTVNYANYDPITGSLQWDNGANFPSDIQDVYAPETSNNTDIRAQIFCATGNGDIIGASCS
ncbi:MAG: hypothetical protein AB1782_00390 [Cyanobacteriota bacterium]